MIAPSPRLIGLALFPGVPLLTVAFLPHPAAPLCQALLALLLLTAMLDALTASKPLASFAPEPPPVLRAVKDRETHIEIPINRSPASALTLNVALDLPAAIEFAAPITSIRIPGGIERAAIPFTFTPRHRGRYPLSALHAETRSRLLRLWTCKKRFPLESELRVYPNLREDRRGLAALFLNRGGIGIHARRQVGKGREFEHLRDYLPGDTYQDIHWKTTAKRNHPVTKAYRIERTQEVYAIIDASRLSARPLSSEPHAPPQIERLVGAALLLGLAAERQGDHFGLAASSNRVDRFLRASSGAAHFNACREALYTLQPEQVNPDYEALFTFIRLRLRRRALLVILTNLDDPTLAEEFERSLRIVARQHLILTVMVQPTAIAPLFSGPPPQSLGGIYSQLAGHYQWRTLVEHERALHRLGATFTLAPHEGLAAELVKNYMSIKQRQLL